MNMKKTVALFCLVAMLLSLAGCGGKSETKLDMAALAGDLLGSGAFSTTLDELPASKASVFYNVDSSKLTGAVMYHGAGISKEQFALFEAADEAAAKAMVPVLQTLLQEWIEADRNYAPAEVPKMEKAVLRQSGVYVVLVVANDPDAAAGIVSKHF